MRRAFFAGLLVLMLLSGAGIAALTSGSSKPADLVAGASPGGSPRPIGASGTPSGVGSGASATPEATPTPTPAPTPQPTPTSRLTGLPTTASAAKRRPIAVMIDDHWDARPQSGFNKAGIVWHALAEGGIPRYMLVFADETATAIGPVRSAREYYLEWAAEWKAVYVHAGGSPQALRTLRTKGSGQWVYNAEDFRWEGTYLWRLNTRVAPHNVYTDSKNLRALAKRLGAKDAAGSPLWQFGPDAPLAERPKGGTITVRYQANTIAYKYDQTSNTYLRFVGGKRHIDAADKKGVAPKNVVVMVVKFSPLNDGHPEKARQEAKIIGKGTAWIAMNGVTIKGVWKKDSVRGATRFYDRKGKQLVLTAGQTFIQVIPKASDVTLKPGKASAATPAPSPSATPAP